MENNSLLNDEIEALSAIYGDEWMIEDIDNRVYSITLRVNDGSPKLSDRTITLQFRFPSDYPLESAPTYTVSAPWMSRDQKTRLFAEFDDLYRQHKGESIVYLWIEKAREMLNDGSKPVEENLEESFNDQLFVNEHHCQNPKIAIFHGHPIVDRRSAFQAHLAVVTRVEQVSEAKSLILANKKVSAATHNISAYRIAGGPHNTCFQDCDDDGEAHAGPQLLHLLEILDVKNVLVVVSRWFGGILLGADRFKHIKNTARELIKDCGFLDPKANAEDKESGKKKKTK